MGEPGIPWALKVPATEVKDSPVALGAWAPRAVQLSPTRVVNRSRRVGGAAGTLSHRLAPRERQREVKGQIQGQVGSHRERKEVERMRREKRKKGRAEGRRSWTEWEREDVGVRAGVPGLESGHGGSLRASRVFTNEGSKKEKRGLERQADPLLEKRSREEHSSSPPQQGSTRKRGGSICPEKRCQLQAHPLAVTPPAGATTPVGLEGSKLPLKMGPQEAGSTIPGESQEL